MLTIHIYIYIYILNTRPLKNVFQCLWGGDCHLGCLGTPDVSPAPEAFLDGMTLSLAWGTSPKLVPNQVTACYVTVQSHRGPLCFTE